MKQLFKWSKSRKLLLDDPLNDIRLNKPTWDPKAGPTLEQVDQILAVADRPLRDWLSVLAFTGMRVGELQRLRREDVDFAGNWIHIRSRPGAETKTKASRKVPIHARLRAVLEQVPASGHVWFLTAGPSPKYPTGGNPINAKKVNDRLAQVLTQLSLPAGRETGFVVHNLRHTFETVTINAGIPQRVIDTWLGHNADRSMAAVYYRLGDADSQRFMQAVPFGGTTAGTTQTPDGVWTNE